MAEHVKFEFKDKEFNEKETKNQYKKQDDLESIINLLAEADKDLNLTHNKIKESKANSEYNDLNTIVLEYSKLYENFLNFDKKMKNPIKRLYYNIKGTDLRKNFESEVKNKFKQMNKNLNYFNEQVKELEKCQIILKEYKNNLFEQLKHFSEEYSKFRDYFLKLKDKQDLKLDSSIKSVSKYVDYLQTKTEIESYQRKIRLAIEENKHNMRLKHKEITKVNEREKYLDLYLSALKIVRDTYAHLYESFQVSFKSSTDFMYVIKIVDSMNKITQKLKPIMDVNLEMNKNVNSYLSQMNKKIIEEFYDGFDDSDDIFNIFNKIKI